MCYSSFNNPLLSLPFVPASHATKGAQFYYTPLEGATVCQWFLVSVAEEDGKAEEEKKEVRAIVSRGG